MIFPESGWEKYIKVLSAIDRTAAWKFTAFLDRTDISTQEGRKTAIDYAYAIATKYGESAAAAACEMYDAVAEASGVTLPAAVPAETATYGEVAKTVNGMAKQKQSSEAMGNSIGRLVKRTGADTTQKNALRDGAEFAWVPHGDTCAFCLMLASNGWQKASKKTIKGDHAEHIHSNCDCTFAVRFDGRSKVGGYDPDRYREMYENAEGDTWEEKLNSMRRANYAENADKIRAQKREAYAARKGLQSGGETGNINSSEYISAAKQAGDTVQPESIRRNYDDFEPLDISEEARADLRELNRLATETDEEHGFSRYPGGKTEVHTDHDHNTVKIPIPKDVDNIELYHCHTDDSVLSPEDFKSVLNPRVNRESVISMNGDVWVVDYSNGIRPTEKELRDAVKMCREEAGRTIEDDPLYDGWSGEERYYMRGREQMYRLGRLFEWRIMGGHIDE